MMNHCAVQAERLGKQYRLRSRRPQHNTLRDLLTDRAKSLILRNSQPEPPRETFWALTNATFSIARGENVGIIGLNGAGKSTLLKLLSRITEPTTGAARIEGRVGTLLEVGTGFHWELTGKENVYLYGAILGMTRTEIRNKYDAILDFAGIKDFIDTPIKRYSSGMYVRLAFSVAAHLEPDILLIDEVLSVGDLSFQRKCIEFAKRLHKRDATILFVSHNMATIKTLCSRVIYLRQGQIQFDGPTDEGIKLYEEDCRLTTLPYMESRADEWPIHITDFTLLDQNGRTKTVFEYGERMKVRLRYEARRPIKDPNFIIAFIRSDGVSCCNYSTELDGVGIDSVNGTGVIELLTPPLKLVSELYTIHVLVREKDFQKTLCAQIGSTFHIRHDLLNTHFGVFHEPGTWLRPSNC